MKLSQIQKAVTMMKKEIADRERMPSVKVARCSISLMEPEITPATALVPCSGGTIRLDALKISIVYHCFGNERIYMRTFLFDEGKPVNDIVIRYNDQWAKFSGPTGDHQINRDPIQSDSDWNKRIAAHREGFVENNPAGCAVTVLKVTD